MPAALASCLAGGNLTASPLPSFGGSAPAQDLRRSSRVKNEKPEYTKEYIDTFGDSDLTAGNTYDFQSGDVISTLEGLLLS